ncbi:unnamed protein product [Toxocara canis]|uniref:AvrRpt-cleavage domain-containing protein n=1 Tax=Toxocara canis TaxID=6265 RepID=A0A183URK3_TOXCA|nr:unnamed protein product [Toxocara canis]
MTPPSQYYWDRFNTARLPDADSDKRFGNKAQNEGEKMRRVDSGKKGSSDLCDEGKSKEDRKETSVDLPETSKKLKSAENLKGVLEVRMLKLRRFQYFFL